MADVLFDRVPPHDEEMEKHVLGAMLLDREAAGIAAEMLRPADFYATRHGQIFECAVHVYDEKQALDAALLREEIERRGLLEGAGGATYLAELAASVPTSAHVEFYARSVRDKSIVRQLIASATEIVRTSYEGAHEAQELLGDAEQKIYRIATDRLGADFADMRDILHAAFEEAIRMRELGGHLLGLPTGYGDLDELSGGFQKGQYIVVAGRPSMGKTSFALNVIDCLSCGGTRGGHRLETQEPTAVFSMETTKEIIAQNLVCIHEKIDAHKFRSGHLSQDEFDRLVQVGFGVLERAPVYIDDTPAGMPIVALRAKARRMVARKGVRLVVVDYMQLMRGSSNVESRQQEVAEISRGLKALASELRIPVLAVCQLNRQAESRTDHRPQLSDLRESGAIEQDADLVLLLHREDYYKPPNEQSEHAGPAKLIIAKNRNGPVGDVNLTFRRNMLRFEPWTAEEYTGQPLPAEAGAEVAF